MALAWVKKVLHCGAPPSPVIESTTDALDDPSSRAARKKERRSLTISRIIALLMVAGLCAVWVSQAEVSKGLQGGTYNHVRRPSQTMDGISNWIFFDSPTLWPT